MHRLKDLHEWVRFMRAFYHFSKALAEEKLVDKLKARSPQEYVTYPTPGAWGTRVCEALDIVEARLNRRIRKLERMGIKYMPKASQYIRLVS